MKTSSVSKMLKYISKNTKSNKGTPATQTDKQEIHPMTSKPWRGPKKTQKQGNCGKSLSDFNIFYIPKNTETI